jgi:hypothetical protein
MVQAPSFTEASMLIRAIITAALAVLVYGAPAHALTAKQKMETCKFGADDQKLKGAPRNAFIKKCMANERTAKPAAAKKKP